MTGRKRSCTFSITRGKGNNSSRRVNCKRRNYPSVRARMKWTMICQRTSSDLMDIDIAQLAYLYQQNYPLSVPINHVSEIQFQRMSKQRRFTGFKLDQYKPSIHKRASSSHKNRILYTDQILETKGLILNTTREKPSPFSYTPDKLQFNKKRWQQHLDESEQNRLEGNRSQQISPSVEYLIECQKKRRVPPGVTLKKAGELVNRGLIDSIKQEFISIYIKQKLRYERELLENGIGENVEDAEFKLFIAKLANY